MIGDAGSRHRVTLGKYSTLFLAQTQQRAADTSDDPVISDVVQKTTRSGIARELFQFVIESMEGKG